MQTKEEIIAQLKKENPTIVSKINDEEIELLGDEYESAIQNAAQMKLEQLLKEKEEQAKAAQKQALLDRLGITQEEAQLLLGGN